DYHCCSYAGSSKYIF
nr:immunoglobulin light chain junction region [Macaca mulatta]MOX42901.1 immunoglobulin light chain junction region [Macaca mulatta]MOX43893.1 immunoglobulin light chain junction region [Macaca mulatta]